MQIFDRKLKKYFPHYIVQSLLATITLTIILYFENIFTNTAVVASLGATTFIIFAMPKYTTARPRSVVGGHIIGIIVGIFCFYYYSHIQNENNYFLSHEILKILIPAISVGLSIFFMVITNTEHPPAAGTALGITIQGWSYSTILVILITIFLLSLAKY
ncbi:MAG TPA: HPP family protein [Candidatus Atribacteria bacterium]|nr:MAG: Putative membrane protein [Atribacteria bacterium 34_128]HAJ33778.1 HPP family protein [Candidatus Atribacteria bacterium]